MALNEAKLKDLFEYFNDYIYLKNKNQTYEESKAFWINLKKDRDQLTAYIMSVLCRIITLDNVPITTTLSEIYDALVLKCDSKANFDAWIAALVKEREKVKKKKIGPFLPDAKEIAQLRAKLLLTLHFVVTFYPEYNIGQIATLISKWKVARESKLLDFELKTISLFGGIDTLDIPKLLRKGTLDTAMTPTAKQVENLIKQCVEKKMRGMRDQFPELSPSLCSPTLVADSLCYLKLLSILDQTPINFVSAFTFILNDLAEITADYSRTTIPLLKNRERLLPYLQLFRELVTRAPSVSTKLLDQAYKTIYAFFLWPVPYCYYARDILNFIDAERICPGFAYRNRLLSEYNIQVKDNAINTYERIYLLIDYAAPQALSFREVFKKAEQNDSAVKIHLLKRSFISILGPSIDIILLDRILRTAGTELLDSWLAELINNTHEVLDAGLLDSQDILDQRVINLLMKMIEFFNEKNPDEKIENITEVTESQTQEPFAGLNAHSLPDTPITVKLLNSLMDPQSPEDIIENILRDGGVNFRASSRNKLVQGNRPKSLHEAVTSASKDSFSSDNVFHRSGSDSKVIEPIRQTTMSERAKTYLKNKKRDGSLSKKPSEDITPDEPGEVDELDNDDVIYVNILGKITSAKQSAVPKPKRGILAKELREGRAVLKLVIAGDDKSVALIVKTFLHVQAGNQISDDIDVVFYYIPLSNADTVNEGEAQLFTGSFDITELQDPLTKYFYENQPSRGGDIWLGRLLGHLDSWYENFVTLPVQCALQICPQFQLNVDDSGDPEKMRLKKKREPKGIPLPPSPLKIIRDTVLNFIRGATRPMMVRNYYVEMVGAGGKHIESMMCHRLEMITRDIGQKATQVGTIPKPASVRLSLHAIQLDGTPYSQIDVPYRRYFVLKATNVPKPGDFIAANPTESGFQVHTVVGEKVGGSVLPMNARYGPTDQRKGWYVKKLVVEAAEKDSFTVSIDKENPFSHISRLVIRPTRLDIMTTDKEPTKLMDEMVVPFMTFWPVDL